MSSSGLPSDPWGADPLASYFSCRGPTLKLMVPPEASLLPPKVFWTSSISGLMVS